MHGPDNIPHVRGNKNYFYCAHPFDSYDNIMCIDPANVLVYLLSAGFGTRLRPYTRDFQKVALGIFALPPVVCHIHNLRRQGFRRFLLNLHHAPQSVKEVVRRLAPPDVHIAYIHEPDILGSGGALFNARDRLSSLFLLLNGDTYFSIDGLSLIRFHRAEGTMISLVVAPRYNRPFTGLQVTGRRVSAIAENKETAYPYMFTGVHCLYRDIVTVITPGFSNIVTDVYLPLVAAGEIAAYVSTQPFADIGSPRALMAGLAWLLKRQFRAWGLRDMCGYDAEANSLYVPPGPAGGHVSDSTLSYDVTLGTDAQVQGSLIMQHNHLPAGTRVSRAIVGPYTYFP